MGWSREGARRATALVEELIALRPTIVVHSDMIRTRRLAERIASRLGLVTLADRRWRERDFGSWEGRSWNAIWRETGDLVDRMMTDPEEFRPGGGGETTWEMADRARAAWNDLSEKGVTLIVAHGGPIAAVRAVLSGFDLAKAVRLVPAYGEYVSLRPAKASQPRCAYEAGDGKHMIADIPAGLGCGTSKAKATPRTPICSSNSRRSVGSTSILPATLCTEPVAGRDQL